MVILAAVLLVCFFYQIEEVFAGESGGLNERGHNKLPCCVSGNFTFYSIADILNNISNNAIVNITTDVVLSTNVTLKSLENITIKGHRNSVVKCNDVGAVKFISCKNVTIEGIQWDGCGSKDYPGIEFCNSSKASFERCSFCNSKGRSILLSKMSGTTWIKHCNFTHKNEYSRHGTAIHYLPNDNTHGQHKLVVQNCKFIFNTATQSVVYADGSSTRITGHVCLQENEFVNNTGVPVFISNSNLQIKGSLLFKGNVAGGGIFSNNSYIIFYGKSEVKFINNSADSRVIFTEHGGAIHQIYSRIIFEANSIVTFKDNSASYGGAIYSSNSDIRFDNNSNVTFNNNLAIYGGGVFCTFSSYITFNGTSSVTFKNNKARLDGGAVDCNRLSHITFTGNSSVTFNNNKGGIISSSSGGAISCLASSHITFDGNSSVAFNNNEAYDGGAIVCRGLSQITFDGNSSVTFNNNEATFGGAVHCQSSSPITFDGSSNVTFNSNKAALGGAIRCKYIPNMTFDGNSRVTFNNNEAMLGGAVRCESSSPIIFDGNSSVAFNNNKASDDGGAVHFVSSSPITFDGNSSVTFYNNKASNDGGAVYSESSSHITFDDNSSVTFNNNEAMLGGAVHCESSSPVRFDGNSSVIFNNNEASNNGGAVYEHCGILFYKRTRVTFNSNKASYDGGAVFSSSQITFDENSIVNYNNNTVGQNGGAIVSSNVKFAGSSTIMFNKNIAKQNGAAICHQNNNAKILFVNESVIIFHDNTATERGGAIYLFNNSRITFTRHSDVTFLSNTAMLNGGAIYSESQVIILLERNSAVTFKNNKAGQSGGALYITDYSTATFTGQSEVIYSNNKVTQYGGAIYCVGNSNIILKGNISIKFTNNTSEYGGALSILQSFILLEEDSSVKFTSNKAENGGAIFVVKSSVTFEKNSRTEFFRNSAAGSGGAIYLSDHFTVNIYYQSQIMFIHNNANHRGGAIFYDLVTKSIENRVSLNTTDITFYKNTDLTDADSYVDMPTSCEETCLNNSIIHNQNQYGGVINTSPRKLVFNRTATCADDDSYTNCQRYLTKNVMLGQEIIINACVYNYFNRPAGATQFILSSEDQGHRIIGSRNVLISCTALEGVRIMGKKIVEATNYSMAITSYDGSHSDLKSFSIGLITELIPCHPGFHYDNDTRRCVCYSDSDIISCSGSTSTIKRGYWFGDVNDKATITVCPNGYCNFTCCETANGYFKLSPVRVNQCNLQRSGTACGSCKEDYTLSFDSIECVRVDKCTTGQTALVVTLSILYWVVIVILVFTVTFYHIGIGYLYAITYYYSVVDILLSEHLYLSQGLFTFISVMSSIAKVTPQFLGQLCLVTNMSGIDQQFIHYAHPLAVAIIVAMICLSARMSYKFSLFVSRGIIHVICFLLLLSYTSMATTSLLLLRSLIFHNVDKVYTYLSPDIEYCHGRHLPYFIIAILCTLVIVVGLPLLLLLEPFINHKINFYRIKPLLDQFQGCYKDKYRSFAAYYMICRLVIIVIIIANSSNNVTSQYSLIILSCLLAFIHLTLRPYGSNILNMFDGFILQLMIVVSMVALNFADSYDPDLLLAFMFLLVALPLIPFVIIEVYLYRNTIKKITNYCEPPKPDTTNDNNEVPMRDFVDSVIDDNSRKNAYICEM